MSGVHGSMDFLCSDHLLESFDGRTYSLKHLILSFFKNIFYVRNKFALLWNEAQLFLPDVCFKERKVMTYNYHIVTLK